MPGGQQTVPCSTGITALSSHFTPWSGSASARPSGEMQVVHRPQLSGPQLHHQYPLADPLRLGDRGSRRIYGLQRRYYRSPIHVLDKGFGDHHTWTGAMGWMSLNIPPHRPRRPCWRKLPAMILQKMQSFIVYSSLLSYNLTSTACGVCRQFSIENLLQGPKSACPLPLPPPPAHHRAFQVGVGVVLKPVVPVLWGFSGRDPPATPCPRADRSRRH